VRRVSRKVRGPKKQFGTNNLAGFGNLENSFNADFPNFFPAGFAFANFHAYRRIKTFIDFNPA